MKRPGAIPLLACHFLLFLQLVGVGYARQSASADWLPKLTLERIHKQGAFTGRFLEAGSWAADGPRQWMVRPPIEDSGAPDIVLRDLVSGRDKRVVSGKELVDSRTGLAVQPEWVEAAPGGRWLLLFSNGEQVWRERTRGRFHLYDLDNRQLVLLTDAGQFATFSPTGRAVAFVRDRDLYVRDLVTDQEVRVTASGSEDGVINGTSDWVYEEEFGVQRAFSWSPDGTQLAWLQLDEHHVPQRILPDGRTFRYPRAGERNAEARVCATAWADPDVTCFDTGTWDPEGEDRTLRDASLPEYLARLGWTREPTPRIWMLRLNRAQDRMDLLATDPKTGTLDTLLVETSTSWVDVSNRQVTFLRDGDQYVWLGVDEGWRHLHLCSIQAASCRPVTSGTWEVAEFLGLDAAEKEAFFTSAKQTPLERQVYRVNLRKPDALPIPLTAEPGVHAADLSPDGAWFVDRFSDAGTPPIWMLRSSETGAAWPLEENMTLRKLLVHMQLPEKEFVSLPAADGTSLRAWVLRPRDFDASQTWPVLFYVYGGPDAQTVTDSWDQGVQRQMWHAWLAETLGVVVVSVDPRGSGGRGREFAGQVKGQLGPVVAADLAAAARQLASESWVDPDRIGIWGWSYGGYATLMALVGVEDSPFSMGVSVAPVTDWRLYDTIYTERYLGTPQSGLDAYAASSVLERADQLREDQHLLLVHGDADDNVHVEHTLNLAAALQQANRQFDIMIYPGRTHSLSGEGTRLHLFSMISRYIEANLVLTLEEAVPPRFAPE